MSKISRQEKSNPHHKKEHKSKRGAEARQYGIFQRALKV